jgi:HK97 family phage major capsid protein
MSFHDHRLALLSSTALETKAEGDTPADVPAAIADLQRAFEEKITGLKGELKSATDASKAAKDRADALEVRMDRPGNDERKDNEPTPEQKAFELFVRRGKEALGPDEFKTLRVADDTAGGFLAPEQFVAELLRNLVQFSPIRTIARVGQMSVGTIKIPKRTGRITAKWVDEIETRPKTEPTYGQLEIVAHEMACFVDVSNQLLEDAALDIAAELSFDFSEEFGRLEGEAFVIGDGVKKPLGILSDPSVISIPAGSTTVLAPDNLLALMYALPPFYRNRGSWLVNGPTIGKIRGMKDSTGRFLWAESIAEGQPPTLVGRPVVEAVDMPDIGNGTTPLAFGDFNSAYRIYDRIGLSVLRDPYTQATNGQTRFHARRRVGAGMVRPEAVRKLVMTA